MTNKSMINRQNVIVNSPNGNPKSQDTIKEQLNFKKNSQFGSLKEMKKYIPRKKKLEEDHKSKKDSPHQLTKWVKKTLNGKKNKLNTKPPQDLSNKPEKSSLNCQLKTNNQAHSQKLMLLKLLSYKSAIFSQNKQNNISKDTLGTQS